MSRFPQVTERLLRRESKAGFGNGHARTFTTAQMFAALFLLKLFRATSAAVAFPAEKSIS
jgi:hypothetical protein